MLTSVLAVFPIFAVIVAGFACGRLKLLGPTASSELNRFVVYLALPALLFQVMAEADWSTLWQPGFATSFAIGAFAIFGATLLVRVLSGHHITDASIDGLNAGYANAGYIGFPLCEMVFGRQSFALVTMAAILTVGVLFAAGIVFVEIGLQTERRAHRLAFKIGRALLRNPLILAPILGALWSTTGVRIPASADTFLHMMGAASSPCALVSLGLFLSAKHRGTTKSRPLALTLAGLKLIGQPAVTALFAFGVFRLPTETAGAALLLSALPTGTGPFMLAEFYKREAVVTSGTILFSTVASIFTLTACILLTKRLGG